MAVFCTISTASHLVKTYALAESIGVFGGQLKVLVVDDCIIERDYPTNIQFLYLKNIEFEPFEKTKKKYKGDKLRWALKPALLMNLLAQYEKVIYIDNDIYFFSDFNFLVEELTHSNVLLTPHFYPSSPKENQTWLEANFRIGLFNAGFIGVNKNAIEALEWWLNCCLYEMKKAYWRGLFDDQKYLDLMPILFDKVKIIKNNGCNFAGWNEQQNLSADEITFIHFNLFSLAKFSKEASRYFPMYKQYEDNLKKLEPAFHLNFKSFTKFDLQNAVYFVRWKISRLLNRIGL